MPRQSAVYEVLIASPSDVLTERRVLAEVLEDWNSAHSRSRAISLQALRWELDGVPASGARPQEILNKQLVENTDIPMAVFGARLGTPTGQAASGTGSKRSSISAVKASPYCFISPRRTFRTITTLSNSVFSRSIERV